jgi:ParB/RepB/Spo0J family partition protein
MSNNDKDTTGPENSKIKTREGSGYLKQLYSTARVTAGTTHSHLKNLTTFMINFVPVEKVDASELQVRTHFEDSEIEGLANSIKLHGVLQPILVVQDGDRYKVVAGERRLRASKLAGMDRIPARVLATDDKATHEIALRENLDRVDLHPIEEGEGYVSLLEAGAYSSHDSIAKAFMKPKSRITECIGFTKLPDETKGELMKRGLKNRSLLRQMLSVDKSMHMQMIEEASTKEEILLDASGAPLVGEAAVKAKAERSKEVKPFEFKFDDKGLSVPSFKWKASDSNGKLEAYAASLRKVVEQIEERLTRP